MTIDTSAIPAICFELENLILPGRVALYQTAERELKKANFNKTTFLKYGLGCGPGAFATTLRKKGILDSEEAATDLTEKLVDAVKDLSVPTDAGKTLLKAAASGKRFGVITMLPEARAKAVLEELNIADRSHVLAVGYQERHHPNATMLMTLARQMSISPRRCTFIATCSIANRAALAARMLSVAAPDEFSAFQDFSGADLLVEGIDAKAAKAIVALTNDD